MLSPPGEYGPRLQAEGFRWIPLQMDRRSINPAHEVKLIFQLFSIYRNEKPDLVHHFTIKCAVYGAFAALCARIPCRVNAIAGLGSVYATKKLSNRLLQFAVDSLFIFVFLGQQSRVILQNPDDYRMFEKKKLSSPSKLCLIKGSGVNTEKFHPNNKQHHSHIRILLATRLLWSKGVGAYIEVAHRSKEQHEIKFLLAGTPDPGNPDSIPESQLNKWQQEKIISYLGHVENMAELLRTVDIVVLPTTYREGVPRILIEAASTGLPLVTTDTPGCKEIVRHNVNGLLVPPYNVDALHDAILFLAADPDKRKRMGLKGRQIVHDKFSEKIIIDKTLDVYNQILSLSKQIITNLI